MALCALSELEQYRVLPGLDIWVVPDFARHVLGCDAALLQTELERAYGIVGKGDAITPAAAQWVDGAHKALNYRGNELKRSKMWFQKGDPRERGYMNDYYAGWTRAMLSATSNVVVCPLGKSFVQGLCVSKSCSGLLFKSVFVLQISTFTLRVGSSPR